MHRLGLTKDGYFCISIREDTYHAGLVGRQNENHRNLDFLLFLPMLKLITKAHTIVRIGRSAPLPFTMPNFIDYSSSDDTDSLADLVLIKNSLGLISSGNGVAAVAAVLGRPCLYIGHFPWEILQTHTKRHWMVPAVYQHRGTKELANPRLFLSDSEIPFSNDFFVERGLERRLPTPDEILLYCQEFTTATITCAGCGETFNLSIDHSHKNLTFWTHHTAILPAWALTLHPNIFATIPLSFLEGHDLFNYKQTTFD